MRKSAAMEEATQRLTDLEDIVNDLTVAIKLYEQAEQANKDKILANMRANLDKAYSRRNSLASFMIMRDDFHNNPPFMERLRAVNSTLYRINRALYANAAQ